jgi:hypothetical protein
MIDNYTLELENAMRVINRCLKEIRKGADPKVEIPFSINVLECVFDTEFTDKQYEEIYNEIYELI